MPAFERQIRRGEMLFTKGRLDDALKVFASVLRADPTNTHALNDAALVLQEMHEYDRATTLLERALGADPANEAAFFNLLDLLRGRQDVGRLVRAFRRYEAGIRESREKAAYRAALAPLLAEMEPDAEPPDTLPDAVLHVTGMAGSGVELLAALTGACAPGAAVATSTLGTDSAARLERLVSRGARVAVVVRDPVFAIAAWNAEPDSPEARVADEETPGYPEVVWATDDRYARQAQLWQTLAASIWAWRDAVRVITYEQLVREPDDVAAELAAWLGRDVPPSLPVAEDENDPVGVADVAAIRAAVARYAPLRKVFGYAEAPRLLTPAHAGDGMGGRTLPGLTR